MTAQTHESSNWQWCKAWQGGRPCWTWSSHNFNTAHQDQTDQSQTISLCMEACVRNQKNWDNAFTTRLDYYNSLFFDFWSKIQIIYSVSIIQSVFLDIILELFCIFCMHYSKSYSGDTFHNELNKTSYFSLTKQYIACFISLSSYTALYLCSDPQV